MNVKDMEKGNDLDLEWVNLIMEARELGIPIEEIRHFFQQTEEEIA